jgi:hypothetical protein
MCALGRNSSLWLAASFCSQTRCGTIGLGNLRWQIAHSGLSSDYNWGCIGCNEIARPAQSPSLTADRDSPRAQNPLTDFGVGRTLRAISSSHVVPFRGRAGLPRVACTIDRPLHLTAGEAMTCLMGSVRRFLGRRVTGIGGRGYNPGRLSEHWAPAAEAACWQVAIVRARSPAAVGFRSAA